MHSWVFRNRKRLELIYGLAPARVESSPPEPKAPKRAPARRGALRKLVLIPAPRRAG